MVSADGGCVINALGDPMTYCPDCTVIVLVAKRAGKSTAFAAIFTLAIDIMIKTILMILRRRGEAIFETGVL